MNIEENKRYCIECGKELESWEIIICSNCDEKLREENNNVYRYTKKKR